MAQTKVSKYKISEIKHLVKNICRIVRIRNKKFESMFILELAVTISSKEFIKLFRSFIRKIQINELYLSVFEFNEKENRLQVNILVTKKFSQLEVENLENYWYMRLVKESKNSLLLKSNDYFKYENEVTFSIIKNIFPLS